MFAPASLSGMFWRWPRPGALCAGTLSLLLLDCRYGQSVAGKASEDRYYLRRLPCKILLARIRQQYRLLVRYRRKLFSEWFLYSAVLYRCGTLPPWIWSRSGCDLRPLSWRSCRTGTLLSTLPNVFVFRSRWAASPSRWRVVPNV